MQTRSSDENSVRLSAKRVDCDKTEKRSVQICIPYEKTLAQFYEKKNGWWWGPFYLKFWVKSWSEITDFEPIFAGSASAVTPSKKVQLALIGSPLRAFQ